MTQDEKLHKEIDLIQNCIARMANNSFFIKGWLLSLIAVVIALLGENVTLDKLALVLFVPVICFWYLDAFFLRTEKKYRLLYKWVLKKRPKNDKHLYDLNPNRFDDKVDSFLKVMLSITLRIFYGIPFVTILVVLFIELVLK